MTTAELQRYAETGFLFPKRVLTPDRAAAYRRQLEASEAVLGGAFTGSYTQKPHLLFTWLDALAREPLVLDLAASVVGPDILLWSTEFFIKNPGDGRFVSWHVDDTYWHIEPEIEVTVWIALTEVTAASGPVRYIPGSHREPRRAIVNAPSRDNMLISGQVAQGVDEARAVPALLGAGEAALHHARMLHASGPNTSTDRRLGIAARYLATAVRNRGARESAMLVRGVDRYGHFDHEPRPAVDLDPAACAAHAVAVEQRLRNMHGDTYRARVGFSPA